MKQLNDYVKKIQIEFNITEDNFDIYYNLLGIKSNKYVET